jgi:hypothetical protein
MLLLLVALLDIAVLLLDTHSSTILDTHRSTIVVEYHRSTTAGVYSSIIAIHVLLLKHKIITVAPFEWKSSPSICSTMSIMQSHKISWLVPYFPFPVLVW